MDFWLDHSCDDWILGTLEEGGDILRHPFLEDFQEAVESCLKGHDSCRIHCLAYPEAFKSTNQKIRMGAKRLSRLWSSPRLDIKIGKIEIESWFRFIFEQAVSEENRKTVMGLLKWNGILFCLLPNEVESISFSGSPDRLWEGEDLLRFGICLSQMHAEIRAIYTWGLSPHFCEQLQLQSDPVKIHQIRDWQIAMIEFSSWKSLMVKQRKVSARRIPIRWRRLWSLLIWTLALLSLGISFCLWQERRHQRCLAAMQLENMKRLQAHQAHFLTALNSLASKDSETAHFRQSLNTEGVCEILNNLNELVLEYSPLPLFRNIECKREGEDFHLNVSLRIFRTNALTAIWGSEPFLGDMEAALEVVEGFSSLQVKAIEGSMGYDDFYLEVIQ